MVFHIYLFCLKSWRLVIWEQAYCKFFIVSLFLGVVFSTHYLRLQYYFFISFLLEATEWMLYEADRKSNLPERFLP